MTVSKPKPFKYDVDTGYIFRYDKCSNLSFYDCCGTKKEFEETLKLFRDECAADCCMDADDVVIELYEFTRYIKGTTKVQFDWDAETE